VEIQLENLYRGGTLGLLFLRETSREEILAQGAVETQEESVLYLAVEEILLVLGKEES